MRNTLTCAMTLQGLLTLLLLCQGASDARFLSFKSISSPGVEKVPIPHLKKDSIELYRSTTIRYVRHPSVSEMCNYVMTKKMFRFKIGKKEFLIYPLDKVVQKKSDGEKVLGYFDRITTVNNSVVIRYKNGDRSILGPQYSSTVQIQSSQQEFYDARFKETPANIFLSLNVSEPLVYDQEIVLGVYRKASGFDPIIQTILEEQSRESKQKRLPPSILKQLGIGMKIPSNAAETATSLAMGKTHSDVLSKADLKRIAKRFKKDLDMAQRVPVPAAEDMVGRSLRVPPKSPGQVRKRLKHIRDEKYETRIASREHANYGQEETEGIEKLSRMFSRYFHTTPSLQEDHISDIQNSILDQNISRKYTPSEMFDTKEEKEGEENVEGQNREMADRL